MLKLKKQAILNWYNEHKRDLPWRDTKNPYFIWLSEIILQQTRVQQGLPYYLKFINRFPTIQSMASSNENELLHLWQGLGYYSRARNMHFTAQYIQNECQGVFPSDYDTIRKLKGVGDYTAAAIASFAFDLPYPAIDGNVLRVISRLEGIKEDIGLASTKTKVTSIANDIMGGKNAALFNQSIMEFGAIQCKPDNPSCSDCPLIEQCYAFRNNLVNKLPLKINKTKVRNRFFNYLILIDASKQIFIQQRKGKGIWQNLFEFPLIESNSSKSEVELIEEVRNTLKCNSSISIVYRSQEVKHKLSHQLLHIQFNIIKCKITKEPNLWVKIGLESLPEYAFPQIINKYKESLLEEIENYGNNS